MDAGRGRLYGGHALPDGLHGPFLTISIPIQFGSVGRSATVSGILDCMLYLGAAISSYLFALLAQWGGWTATIVSWIVIPLIAIGILLSRKNLEPETAEKSHL